MQWQQPLAKLMQIRKQQSEEFYNFQGVEHRLEY
jgi:hypothetical protein